MAAYQGASEFGDGSQSPESRQQIALRRISAMLPRPLRFIIVGGLGLTANILFFTVLLMVGFHVLLAGFVALIGATFVTWRLNRAFTFDRSGRPQGKEAMRYAIVTAIAQGTSYAVFAGLALTILAPLPQAAIVSGAAAGALISYNGHRLFAFAPHHPATTADSAAPSNIART
jgi:putative flippase GtrA